MEARESAEQAGMAEREIRVSRFRFGRWAWLAGELLAGMAIVVALARRNSLSDYAWVLPVAIIVGLAAVLAAVLHRRAILLFAAVGAVAGTLLYDPPQDERDYQDAERRVMSQAWLMGKTRLVVAFWGASVAVALGWGLRALNRHVWKEGRLQFTLRFLFAAMIILAAALSCWKWLVARR
jgi:hypothetical protein